MSIERVKQFFAKCSEVKCMFCNKEIPEYIPGVIAYVRTQREDDIFIHVKCFEKEAGIL